MNTRTYDLGELERKRDQGSEGARKTLEKISKQSKSFELEMYRKKLVQAHKRLDHDEIERLEKFIKENF